MVLSLFTIITLWFIRVAPPLYSAHAIGQSIGGRVVDTQGEPVQDAEISLLVEGEDTPLAQTHTQDDGTYLLILPEFTNIDEGHVLIERHHFSHVEVPLTEQNIADIHNGVSITINEIVLERVFQLAFWVTTITFMGMLFLIATERLHKTLASLLAVSVIFGVSAVGGFFSEALFITDFEMAIEHVDFDVIFLLLGMMIVIGIIEETGIFQWMAYQAYKLSKGKAWLLSIILMLITAIASALLDNVTTMLLMTPITLQIALAMGVNPLTLLLPEVLASNVGGISTLIGTPTNILIGSYADLGFADFLINQTPGVILAIVGLIIYVMIRYRKEYQAAGSSLSPALLERLEANAQIKDMDKLKRSGVVFFVLMIMFIFGESIHLEPAVSAIIGAVAMLIWVHPHIEETLHVVDWTTLIFFIGLFIVIGAVQEVGLIFLVADWIAGAVGNDLNLALVVVIWSAAIMSGVVDNIPFAAAMLPVVDYLSGSIPATDKVLFYGLSVGAAMGGNTSLIGASANLVTAGISARAGYPISFKTFLSIGLPAMVVTVFLGTIWLLIRF